MKGSTAQIILKGLPEQRLETFIASLSSEASGSVLQQLCRYYITAASPASESETYNHLGLSRGQYAPKFALLCQRLLEFLVGDRDSMKQRYLLELASDLAFAAKYEAAVDLIGSGMRKASQTEDFELLVAFCEVLDRVPDSEIPDKIDQVMIRNQHQNLATYSFLFTRLRHIAQQMNPVTSAQVITETLANPAMAGPEMALSRKALYFYWRIRFAIHTIRRENIDASRVGQYEILPLLRENPWITTDHEFELAKQTKLLGERLRAAGELDRYEAVLAEFEAMELTSLPARQQRTLLRYPAEFAIAIEMGDSERIRNMGSSFLQLIREPGTSYPLSFVTENLYCCLYGAITTSDTTLWAESATMIFKYQRSEFRLLYYPMSRFLEVIYAIDQQDWDSAFRLAKNLRRSEAADTVQGMNEALAYLMPPTYAMMHHPKSSFDGMLEAGWEAAAKSLQGTAFCDYFDLTAWYEARAGGCTLSEILRRRTASPRQP